MVRNPVFFHISPDQCGGARLARLFSLNGYEAICDEKGKLAEDIAWAQMSGQAPLRGWPEVRLFTGLYRLQPWWRPPLEGWRSFAFLRQHFPDARFILTTRDMEAWLLDRMTAANGAAAKAYAAHWQVEEGELPDLWARDWQSHLEAVETYFEDDPALIRVDTKIERLDDLRGRLAELLPMPRSPKRPGWHYPAGPGLERILLRMLDPAPETPRQQAEAFIEDVAGFCLRGRCQPGTGELDSTSPLYSEWDGGSRVFKRTGKPHPLAIGPQPGSINDIAVARPGLSFKERRAEGVINDILRLGRRDPVNIDMEDARWIGAPHRKPLGKPVLCHNRREGARNLVLWPLPEQMGPGFRGYEASCPDNISFEDKEDRLVWRGMISGNERREGVRPGPSSLSFLRRLAEAGNDPVAREKAWQGLCRTSRMAFIRRWFGHPDFDIGIAMAWGFREFARDPLIAPYCTSRKGPAFFHGFRYQLCMTGYDHGSNFIQMINSQSVLLKEEDGWEVYYSGRFKPWKHYIPVQRYCDDIAEKLAWARENTNECKEMSRAARAEVALLSDPVLMRAIKGRILDGLASAG